MLTDINKLNTIQSALNINQDNDTGGQYDDVYSTGQADIIGHTTTWVSTSANEKAGQRGRKSVKSGSQYFSTTRGAQQVL